MSKKRRSSSSRRGGKKSKKNFIAFLIIVAIAAIGYYYITDLETQDAATQAGIEHKEDYILLENNDSAKYKAQIILNKKFNILDLSKIFYNSDIFWPYIIQANPTLENPLNIEKNTLVKIPCVKDSLLDTDNELVVEQIKLVGDSIMNVIAEKRKPKVYSE
ncbi:hypothetical protein D0T53_11610 [Dysgonomonas sp. 216]|uniref:hypothetical protein n=1 Tax=Dysgonomonas sp. 216 TaxID=2302934 RepID=UPI0013CF481D|nr:hypothetical protein [Dysgonomonas sp. 216]NDW19552.1 hypothetical protein [Dysgonomonas sp. 216]